MRIFTKKSVWSAAMLIAFAAAIAVIQLSTHRDVEHAPQIGVDTNPQKKSQTKGVTANGAQVVSERPEKPDATDSPAKGSPEVPPEIIAFEERMAEAFSMKNWSLLNTLLDEALEHAKDQSRDHLFRGHFITSAASLLATLRANQELSAETEEQWTSALSDILTDEAQHEHLRGRAALTAGHGGLTGMLDDIWKVAESKAPISDGSFETRALVGASHLDHPANFATRATSVLKNALVNRTEPLADAAALLIAEAGQTGPILELLNLRREHRDSKGLRLSLASVSDWENITDIKDPERVTLIMDNLDAPALNGQTCLLADTFVKKVMDSQEWGINQQKQFKQLKDAAFLMEAQQALEIFRILRPITELDSVDYSQKNEIKALFNHFNQIAENERK